MHATLDRLAAEYWDLWCQAQPSLATRVGFHQYDGLIEDFSDSALAEQRSELARIDAAALRIDPGDLDEQERTTLGMLRSEIDDHVAVLDTRVLVAACEPGIGPHSSLLLQLAPSVRPEDPAQAEAILQRYRQVGSLLDQTIGRHRSEVEEGRPPARSNVERVLHQIDGYLASPLDGDPFAATPAPSGWDGADQWKGRMESVVTDVVRPAFARYRDGVATDVLPHGRPPELSGLVHVAGGEDIYNRLAGMFTSLPADPEALHRVGYEHATEGLVEEYSRFGASALGTADLETTLNRLRDDPSLRFETAAEIVEHARETLRRANQVVPDWFAALPVTPCEVEEVPAVIAADVPPAYYLPPPGDGSRPGIYFVNTSAPNELGRWAAQAIHVHEAVPGHHFQLALAAELSGIPTFRRFALPTAHVEGWGLYTERLADEMGIYQSDLDRLGMLGADSWRAGRLVVDTGLHALGWTRQQAIDFLQRTTALSPTVIAQEVDRYIGVPGQALAYKVGQMEIFRLRRHAEQQLGARFDIRQFHDVVLTSGSVTLQVLGGLVERWLAGAGR